LIFFRNSDTFICNSEGKMKSQKVRFFPLFCAAVFLLVLSCTSTPPPPGPEDLARLNVAKDRAQTARNSALEVQGQGYFPDEWKKAEADNNTGRNAPTDTLAQVEESITLLGSAADAYDSIAAKSGPLLAKDMEDARNALEEAAARAGFSRQNAQDSGAEKYFSDEWQNAEVAHDTAKDTERETLAEIKAVTAQFNSAADMYDALAGKSAPLLAKDNAQKDLDAAIARVEQARQQATDVDGQTYSRNDSTAAEAALQAARDAGVDSTDEMNAAAAQFAAAAAMYDSLAGKSAPLFAKDRDDAARALQAAVARAEQSRRQVSGANGQNSFPNEWRDAESKNQTAQNARRATIAEMRAAVPLYTTAADAYDNIARLNAARVAEQNRAAEQARAEEARRNMNNAKTLADAARQAAVDARAHVAVQTDFNNADGVYRQAVTASSNANQVAAATDGFNRSAAAFNAAANAALTKRRQAEEAVARSIERSAQSVAHATNIGHIMDGITEDETEDDTDDETEGDNE
jgi:hypothetical protein